MFHASITSNMLRGLLLMALGFVLLAPPLAGSAEAAVDPVVAAVGDMGCAPTDPNYNAGLGTANQCRQKYVSDLLVNPVPSALLDLGDNQYVAGELVNYQTVYDPTFGRANAVVYPSLGNAEYDTLGAQGFFDYFSSAGVTSRIGAATGADTSNWAVGYYSFDIGPWHLIVLNSNCQEIDGGCKSGGLQETWLKNDLAAHPNRCTLAYWHHPRWNSGALGNDASTAAFWTDLYNAHADLVLNGHGNHHYERFMPQNPAGSPDPANGVREFIVSTGGESHGTPPGTPGDQDTSEIADYTSFGVMKLTLRATGYDWQFVPAVGGSFTDSGTGTCHSAPAAQPPSAPALSATADSVVHLSWNAPANGGAAITGYNIYRGTTAAGETLLKTVQNVTSYDDAGVTGNTKYYYRVAAVNTVGEGSQSNEVSTTTAAPPPPFPGTSVIDDFARAAGALGSSWQSPGLADPGAVSIEGSGVTKSGSGASSATWSAASFTADQEAYLTVPTLPSNGNFIQVAGRVSKLGSSGVSCYFLRLTPSSSTWDLRKKLNGGGSTSMKTFSAPFAAGDGAGLRIMGSGITAFRKAGAGAWTAVGATTDTSIPGAGYVSFTLGDTTVRGGTFGGGSFSAPQPAQPPAAPALSATSDTVVHLSWNAPSDGGAPISGYNVYRGTTAGGETLLKSGVTGTTYDDAAVSGGTKYFYRVAAVNSVGEGAQSNEVSPTTAAVRPAAPTLSATADTVVHLSWNAPADGGAPISGYNVYRGTAAGGETLLKGAVTGTTYDDAAVTGGTKYFYRVAAVNSVGEGTQSNEVSAAPTAAPPPPLPFPRTPVLDNFARSAGALGVGWQSPALADAGTAAIVSSGLTKSGSGASSATWNTQTFTADQEAYLTVPTLPIGGNFIQVAVRVSNLTSSTVSCYFLRVTPSSSTWDLRKKLNGGGSTSIKTLSAPFVAGDSLGIQVIGSTLTAYRKPGTGSWSAVGSATDTSIAGPGYVSFTLGDTTMRGGAFGGGSIN